MKRGFSGKKTVGPQDRRPKKRGPGQFTGPKARATGISSMSVFQKPGGKERKALDVSTTGMVVAATAGWLAPVLLNGCGPGTDLFQHVGRETTMTSLYWQFRGSMAATSTGGSPIRLLIVYDKEANGAAPTMSTAAQTDILATNLISSHNNLNNRDRYITLVDEIIEYVGASGPAGWFRKGYRKISLPCVFNATGDANIASINTGSIYASVCQDGNIATANPTMALNTRIRFTDV